MRESQADVSLILLLKRSIRYAIHTLELFKCFQFPTIENNKILHNEATKCAYGINEVNFIIVFFILMSSMHHSFCFLSLSCYPISCISNDFFHINMHIFFRYILGDSIHSLRILTFSTLKSH